jgi:ribonuclease P protein subunit POP4
LGADAQAPFRPGRKRGLEFLCGELIGLHAEVESSKRKGLAGLKGIVTDETRNALVIRTSKGDKLVPKGGTVFIFEGRPQVLVKGDWIVARPEDRTKRVAELLWKGRMV